MASATARIEDGLVVVHRASRIWSSLTAPTTSAAANGISFLATGSWAHLALAHQPAPPCVPTRSAERTPVVGDVIAGRAGGPGLVYVQPTESVRRAVQLMRQHEVSQLPVAKNEMPLAAAEVVGAVSELQILDAVYHDETILDRAVAEAMGPRLPTIGVGQPVHLAVEQLETAPALLVLDGGRPTTIIARSDL